MNIKDLIARLSTLDPEMVVYFQVPDGLTVYAVDEVNETEVTENGVEAQAVVLA